jgi:hypothetical protein
VSKFVNRLGDVSKVQKAWGMWNGIQNFDLNTLNKQFCGDNIICIRWNGYILGMIDDRKPKQGYECEYKSA